MEFQTLGKKERKLLFNALEIDTKKLKCQYCNKKLTYDKCGIFPSVNTTTNATFVCNSPLCMAEYFTDLDRHKDRVRELEQMASKHMTGEDVENLLEDIDPLLRDEYIKLMDE